MKLNIRCYNNLNFAAHVNYYYLGEKIGSKLGVFRRISENLTVYEVIYKTIIAPLFEYCSPIILSLSDNNMKYLQKLQNKGMRIILRYNNRTRIEDMLETLFYV